MVESSVHDRLFCWHQHSGSVHGYSEIRSRSKLSVHCCTNFGFIRFVWPCLDDSDICDLLWRIKCSRNFRPPLWILPRVVQITAYELKSQSTGNKSVIAWYFTRMKFQSKLSISFLQVVVTGCSLHSKHFIVAPNLGGHPSAATCLFLSFFFRVQL